MTSWREMAIAQEAADRAAAEADAQERWEIESDQAEESRWDRIMRRHAVELPAVSYSSRPWLNRGRTDG